MENIKLRFLTKVKKSPQCWIWVGGKSLNGYGKFFLNGKLTEAHRASYAIFRGVIPPNMCVCHTCDNPCCVNPKHLWLGTRSDNMQDMLAKGRGRGFSGKKHTVAAKRAISYSSAKMHNKRRSNNTLFKNQKLTFSQLIQICKEYKKLAYHKTNTKQLAEKYMVSARYIRKIHQKYAKGILECS